MVTLADGFLKSCNVALPCIRDPPILPASNDVSNLFFPRLTVPLKALIALNVSIGLKDTPENVMLPRQWRSAIAFGMPQHGRPFGNAGGNFGQTFVLFGQRDLDFHQFFGIQLLAHE